ncbi:YolD-like family protein [Ureibacillus sinduriensis]|uniref:YolD-like family protein n=1 Tax=Ureibacillus sinduriensis TaxID=561440 RepID=UPI0005621931|nr:YolD-like family protein [Ureibacillus sinduriensis]
MIRDRGNIKWNAMMLPEHVKLLREWHEKDDDVEKPELDEWALQELSEQLKIAYTNNSEVEIKVWEDWHVYKVEGKIAELNIQKSALYLEDGRRFLFSSLLNVTILS